MSTRAHITQIIENNSSPRPMPSGNPTSTPTIIVANGPNSNASNSPTRPMNVNAFLGMRLS